MFVHLDHVLDFENICKARPACFMLVTDSLCNWNPDLGGEAERSSCRVKSKFVMFFCLSGEAFSSVNLRHLRHVNRRW